MAETKESAANVGAIVLDDAKFKMTWKIPMRRDKMIEYLMENRCIMSFISFKGIIFGIEISLCTMGYHGTWHYGCQTFFENDDALKYFEIKIHAENEPLPFTIFAEITDSKKKYPCSVGNRLCFLVPYLELVDNDCFNMDFGFKINRLASVEKENAYNDALDGKFCDVKIHVNDRQYSCHKLVLSKSCKFFDAIADKTEVIVPCFSRVFDIALRYIYTGSISIGTISHDALDNTLMELMELSKLLGLEKLTSFCLDTFTLISRHDLASRYLRFKKLGMTDVASNMEKYMATMSVAEKTDDFIMKILNISRKECTFLRSLFQQVKS